MKKLREGKRNFEYPLTIIGGLSSLLGLLISIFSIFFQNSILKWIILSILILLVIFFGIILLRRLIRDVVSKEFDFVKTSFTKIDFYEYLEHSITKQNIKNLDSIDIILHTGENFLKRMHSYLCALINETGENQITINVLVKNPWFERRSRRNKIIETIRVLDDKNLQDCFQINYQFYQFLPTFRYVCFNFNSEFIISKKAFFSFYYFPEKFSQRSELAYLIEEKNGEQNPLIQLMDTWIRHLWGKNLNKQYEIHTILLDFDDTIVNSHQSQIDAWIELINLYKPLSQRDDYNEKEKIKRLSKEQLSEELLQKINHPDKLEDYVKTTFFKLQSGEKIFSHFFDDNIPDDIKNEMKDKRMELRSSKLNPDEVQLFPYFEKTILELYKKYNLIIISATDEQIIKDYLKEIRTNETGELLISYFDNIFGKYEPGLDWDAFKNWRKTEIILKAMNFMGVPPSRLVYIGDNNSDYEAACNIGIDFIEARQFHEEVKKYTLEESLIKSGKADWCFKKWSELPDIIKKIEEKKKSRINQLKPS